MNLRAYMLSLSLAGLGGSGASAQGPQGLANVAIRPGIQFIANPFKGADNTVAQLIPQPAEGTELYTFTGGVFKTNKVVFGSWGNPYETLSPGEGAVVFNPSTKPFTATFNGQLLQGNLINQIPAGLSLKSSLVPMVGGITSTLGLKLAPFDNVYQWRSNRFEVYTLLPDGNWFPDEPRITVAEAFFIRAHRATNWVRVFNINP